MLFSKRWGHFVAVTVLGIAALATATQAQLPFSAPLNVSNNNDFSATPQVAADSSGNVFVVWEDDGKSSGNILFSRSADGGATFSSPVSLSNTKTFPFGPRIAVDSQGGINVVWMDSTSTSLDIFFTRSTDGGATFSSPVNVSHDANTSSSPQVAVDSTGNIFVAWENDSGALGILLSRSVDGGATFSASVMVSTNTTGSINPQLAVGPTGNVYVAWEDDTPSNSSVSFNRSLDHGQTFSAPQTLSNGTANNTNPQLKVDLSGNVNAVWENDNPGNFEIFFTRSTDAGQTFSTPSNVSNTPGSSTAPLLATDNVGGVDVVWLDAAPPSFNTNIFFSRSADGGVTFSPAVNLSNTSTFASNPAFAVDFAGNINVVWQDSVSGPNDIFFARSSNLGATFATPQNLSNNNGESSISQIVADKNGSLNVVWTDSTPGVNQVFFSRFTNTVVNHPPVADAGLDQNIQATSQSGALVQLDGSKSSDPDKDTLTYVWTDQSNTIVGTTASVQFNLLPGTYAFTLTVTDPSGLSNSATTHVTVTAPPNHPPVANAGVSQTIGCTGPNGASVTLNGSGSSDPDGDALNFVWRDASGNIVGTAATVQLTVPVGTSSFTLTVTDPGGLNSSASTSVTIQDRNAPRLTVSLSPNSLQPPNHQLVPVTATISASEACSANVSVKLVSIVSSEPDQGMGNGDLPNDIQSMGGGPVAVGSDVRSFQLRAENAGTGSGRTYTVTYTATNVIGSSTMVSAVVSVPVAVVTNPGSGHHDGDGCENNNHDGHHNKDRRHDKDHDKDHDDKKHDGHDGKDHDDKDHHDNKNNKTDDHSHH